LSFAKKCQSIGLIPGTKFCISCRKIVIGNDNNTETDDNDQNDSDSDYEPNESFIGKLDESCQLIECSPLKVRKRKTNDRGKYLKNKA
jgi:hypothetical protein